MVRKKKKVVLYAVVAKFWLSCVATAGRPKLLPELVSNALRESGERTLLRG